MYNGRYVQARECKLCRAEFAPVRRRVDALLQERVSWGQLLQELRRNFPALFTGVRPVLSEEDVLFHATHTGKTYVYEQYQKKIQKKAERALSAAKKTDEYKETERTVSRLRAIDLSLQDYKAVLDHLIVLGHNVIQKIAQEKPNIARHLAPILRGVKECVSVAVRISSKTATDVEEDLLHMLENLSQEEEEKEDVPADGAVLSEEETEEENGG